MKLYKYRGMESLAHTLDIIINQRLYCARYAELNDPFEGQFTALTEPVVLKSFLAKTLGIDQLPARKVMRSLGSRNPALPLVCSLSTDPTDVRLWSFYAQSHKGIAIEIDFGDDNPAHEVHYEPSLPHFDSETLSTRDDFVRVLTQKTNQWKYEAEYRIIGDKSFFPVKGKISRVLVGGRFSPLHASILKSVCPKDMPIIVTKLDPDGAKVVETRKDLNVKQTSGFETAVMLDPHSDSGCDLIEMLNDLEDPEETSESATK